MSSPINQSKIQNTVEDLHGIQTEGMDIFNTKKADTRIAQGTKQSITSGYIEAAKSAIATDEAANKAKHRTEHAATIKYDLAASGTNATIKVYRNGVEVTPGTDALYGFDEITATATANTGYTLSTFTLNDKTYVAGSLHVVEADVTFAATATINKYKLARTATGCTITVTKSSTPVLDGDEAVTYGDVLTITATAEDGKAMSTLTVNGETFVSGSTFTVAGDVTIIGVAE